MALQPVNNAGSPIANDRTTWIVIHGVGGSPASVQGLATAVDAMSSTDQVLVVDWSQLAATSNLSTAVDNTRIVADTLAVKIKQLGLPAADLNLIGFSLGALIAGRLAADLHARDGVNRIIALDPAAPQVSSGGHSYHPTLKLAADSKYSIAFHAGSDSSDAAASADDSVLITNVGSTFEQRHQAVFDLFTTMARANAAGTPDAVGRVFSVTRILSGDLPAWRKNAYSKDYEAVLDARGGSSGFVPGTLQYKSTRNRQTVVIKA